MRILLLGELSGVHQELAPSLRALGHEVVTGHSRLANSAFESDIPFYRPPAGRDTRWTQMRDIASQLFHAPSLAGFDIVQVMTPKFFNWKIHRPMIGLLKQRNRRMVVVSTACASDTHRRFAELRYRPCRECLAHDLKTDHCIYDRPDERRAEAIAYDAADAIVVTHFEYEWVLGDTPYAAKLVGIPLPIDTNRHRPSPMPAMDRIRIWYGETRHGFKGGPFILPALERLQRSEFTDRVEVVRSGRLPFDDYLDFLESVHIVIDQASSHSAGMNALYALARGRVALSGAEPESLRFIGVSETENPIVNIKPDADHIYQTLVGLISDRAKLAELGRRSADYIARFHSAALVAQRYDALYRQLLHSRAADKVSVAATP